MANETILLVDDEEKVLSSLSRSLLDEELGEILTAQNGLDALAILRDNPKVALIVSDFYMPGLNGIEFLEQARAIAADTTRILLTGAADLEMAVEAVNRGNLFRFLIKPCAQELFASAVKDGIRQHQLITGERELLSNTLNGSIKMMIEILGAVNPEVFARSGRLRKLAKDLIKAMEINEQAWEIELSALLSNIGAVAIPRAILLKWQAGKVMDPSEKEMMRSIPRIGAQVLKNIPRLENISKAVAYQDCTFMGQATIGAPTGKEIPFAARVLKVITDYDRFQEATRSSADAFQAMLKHEWEYDPQILDAFEKKVLQVDKEQAAKPTYAKPGEKKIRLGDLRIGMELSRDVVDKNGILIVSKGTVITDVLRYKLENYCHSQSINDFVFIEYIF